ncbi:MAG TPA: hypothetical protein DC063_03705 [Arenimonas sp.]|nr:MAG: hypothetical protein A2X76_07710 [Xanthomonadales bacterium GWF1_69_6]HBD19270.1 hypothetical protein [Arenimonas sp.]
MDEMMLAGIVVIASALPGLVIGLMLLTGKWDPVSIKAARDPSRARAATARLLLVIDALLLVLGVALLFCPREHATALAVGGVGAVTLAATLLAIAAVKASKA